MNAEEWDSCTHFPTLVYSVRIPELVFARPELRRKGRLFGCATLRTVWEDLPADTFQVAIRHIEDNAAVFNELRFVLDLMEGMVERQWELVEPVMVLCGMSNRELYDEIEFAWPFPDEVNFRVFRDIFGNPFRPVAFDPNWRTEHTIGLALRMYDDRDFAAMPILADALQEAGCEDAAILTHCREPGTHVRGCWVVDWVLGKA